MKARAAAPPEFSATGPSPEDLGSVPLPDAADLAPTAAAPATFLRIFRGFTLARAVLGVLLLAVQGAMVVYSSSQPSTGVLLVCVAYAAVSLGLSAWALSPAVTRHGTPLNASGRLRPRWALLTLGVDLTCFGALLVWAAEGSGLNMGALFALPALMAAALLPRRLALAVAAGAVLLLLAAAWLRGLAGVGGDLAAQLSQAGLTGAAMFGIAFVTTELADRLARQTVTARQTLVLAREQALLNQLMIEEMQDGVMVVDHALQVRAANPAALALIGADRHGASGPAGFALREQPAWQPLCRALEWAYAQGFWPPDGQALNLRLGQEPHVEERSVRLRLRFTRRLDGGAGAALCVLFIEDMRQLHARARQEKLAAMGRVSAGIAHEIRNPLAAISQANALLAEDLLDPAQRRLARMVADNVERLQRIVDDVLEVAPGQQREAPVIDLAAHTAAVCQEWARTVALQPAGRLHIDVGAEPLTVRFEPDSLRRVLINLLDNGLRHASDAPQALLVRAHARGQDDVLLSVTSDGAPIAADIEPYLFEPFFSTRSRGSGLGLYICRELCERHGAAIDYRSRGAGARHRNVFVLTVPRAAHGPTAVRPPTPSLPTP